MPQSHLTSGLGNGMEGTWINTHFVIVVAVAVAVVCLLYSKAAREMGILEENV